MSTDLRAARLKAGYSLRALADKLGVSHSFVWEVERGVRAVPKRLADEWLAIVGPASGGKDPLWDVLAYLRRHPEAVDELRARMRDEKPAKEDDGGNESW